MSLRSLLWICILYIPGQVCTQDTIKTFSLSFGTNFLQAKEMHYTSNYRKGLGYNVSIRYDHQKNKSIQSYSIDFLQTKIGRDFISISNILKPEITYGYLRRVPINGLFVGGAVNIGGVMNFRQGLWSFNNRLNYTFWTAVEIAARYQKELHIGHHKLYWTSHFTMPILTNLMRPSYTFPYPENYLESGIFNFNTDGITKSLLTSGKMVTVNKFVNTQFRTGLSAPIKNCNWSFGLNYILNYIKTSETKSISYLEQQVNITIKYSR